MASFSTQIYFLKTDLQMNNPVTYKWDSLQEQTDSMESLAIKKYNACKYLVPNCGSFIIDEPLEDFIGSIDNANYLMFKNPDENKWYYAFIVGNPQWNSENSTKIFFTIDSIQTRYFDMDLSKKSYIERRHISSDNDEDNLVFQTMYEDFDIGNDYFVTDFNYDSNNSVDTSYGKESFWYISTTQALRGGGDGTGTEYGSRNIEATSRTYTKPNYNSSESVSMSNAVTGVLFGYLVNYNTLYKIVNTEYFNQCMTQGTVVSIVKVPFGRDLLSLVPLSNIASDILGDTYEEGCEMYTSSSLGNLIDDKEVSGIFTGLFKYINENVYGTDSTEIPQSAIGKYMLRYPYSILTMNDFINQPFVIRPEQLNRADQLKPFEDNKIDLLKVGSLGTTPTLSYSIVNYKTTGFNPFNDNKSSSLYALFNSQMFVVQSPLSLPIVSDMLVGILQSSQNQIQAERINLQQSLNTSISNAGASLKASKQTIAISQAQNQLSAQTAYNNSQISANTTYQNTALSALMGFMGNTVGGAMAGGTAGAFGGAISGGINAITTMGVASANRDASMRIASNNLQNALSISNAQAQSAMIQAQTAYANTLRTSNTGYYNSIRSLTARLEDASNMPDQLQSQGNNASIFNIMFSRDCISFTTSAIQREAMKRLANTFTLYGFEIARLETIESVFNKFTEKNGFYIKTINATILGDIPQEELYQIKQIFDSGITFFKFGQLYNYDSMLYN